jgi:hypothetical protein
MIINMKIFSHLFLIFIGFFYFNVSANEDLKIKFFQEKTSLQISNTKIISVKYKVENFKINCKKQRLVVWGHSFLLNKKNPQETHLTLINLENGKIIKSLGYTKNIYGVSYFSDESYFYVDTSFEQIVNANTGKIVRTVADPLSEKFIFEKC